MNSGDFVFYTASAIRVAPLVLIGIPFLRWGRKKLLQVCSSHISKHSTILLARIFFYGGLLCIAVTVLHEFGFNVTGLLGIAGVFGVAIGFAAQTSISNIISGFFLVLERPFYIGDTINSDEMTGVVESIDLLSLTVRTFDNKLVRLPNESVLKNHLTNLTYYPTKRLDLLLSVPYDHEVGWVKSQIFAIIDTNEMCLADPSPQVVIQKIASPELSTEIRVYFAVRVWASKKNFPLVGASLMEQLKKKFDQDKRMITIIPVN